MKLYRALLGLMAMVLICFSGWMVWQMVNVDGSANDLAGDVAEYPIDVVVKPTTQHEQLLSWSDVIFLVCLGGIVLIGFVWDKLIQNDRG